MEGKGREENGRKGGGEAREMKGKGERSGRVLVRNALLTFIYFIYLLLAIGVGAGGGGRGIGPPLSGLGNNPPTFCCNIGKKYQQNLLRIA